MISPLNVVTVLNMKPNFKFKTVSNFILLATVISWGGCQTAPKIVTPQFPEFQIQKITGAGIETVTVKPSSTAWPEVVTAPKLTPLATSTKDLRLAIIGDTGCRLKEGKWGNSYQDCSITKEWPYSEVVQSLEKENYNFLVHTGDYHYREQCTDAKLCPAYGKYIGYVWGAWWDDFYGPSQSLFKKSPILFVRGNHEDCNRAYVGWAPLSAVSNKKFIDTCTQVEPFQWVEMDDIVFINFDNAMMEERKELNEDERAEWKSYFVTIKNRIDAMKTKKEIWFLSHKPMFGYVPDKKDAEPKAIDTFMSDLLKSSGLYDKVDIFLAGHIHTQQVVPLAAHGKPAQAKLQLVVAHSGTSVDPFGRKILTPDKIMTTTENKYSFGYALFEKLGFKKWKFIFKDTKGVTQLECQSNANKVYCE
ncbi:MAG: metallophosphoesterase [Bdellovibrio sp.]|nr:metallophosphoesterase [Bdellovibrio sp.]